MKNVFVLSFTFLLISFFSFSQLQSPVASPRTEISQQVGLIDMNLNYSRPSKKGRVIFGGLLSFDQIWRTGANNPTTISFSGNIKINNQLVEKGEYHIYSVPTESMLELVIYEKTDLWGSLSKFDESLVKARVMSDFVDLPYELETFTISFNNISNNGLSLNIMWDNKVATYSVDVLTKEKMIKNIDNTMAGNPTNSDYRKAAMYFYEENIDTEKALKWIDIAFKDSDDLKYWQLRYKALIYEKAGRIKKAKEYAKKGYKQAKESNIPDGIKTLEIIVDRLSNS